APSRTAFLFAIPYLRFPFSGTASARARGHEDTDALLVSLIVCKVRGDYDCRAACSADANFPVHSPKTPPSPQPESKTAKERNRKYNRPRARPGFTSCCFALRSCLHSEIS